MADFINSHSTGSRPDSNGQLSEPTFEGRSRITEREGHYSSKIYGPQLVARQIAALSTTSSILAIAFSIVTFLSTIPLQGSGPSGQIVSAALLIPGVIGTQHIIGLFYGKIVRRWIRIKESLIIEKFAGGLGILTWGLSTLSALLLGVNFAFFLEETSGIAKYTIGFSIIFLILGLTIGREYYQHSRLTFLQRLLIWQLASSAAGIAILYPHISNSVNAMNATIVFVCWLLGAGACALLLEPLRFRMVSSGKVSSSCRPEGSKTQDNRHGTTSTTVFLK